MNIVHNHNKGFTLIEIIISVSVLVILGGISLVSFTGSRNTRDITTSTQNVLSVLRLAQSKTLAGENNSPWGVHLDSDQIVLFQGDTYAGSPLTNAFALPSSVELNTIALNGGGSDVIFQRVTGQTSQSGTFILSVVSSPTNAISITIDGSGKVYPTTPVPGASIVRVTDTRHRSFALGWSIKTANTLTLTFSDPPNPDTIENISMSSFFDAGPTKFDWAETISIGGIGQILRIHTTSLTDTDTVLSIDRDCRKNNKKLTIAIDAKIIAIYEADCATITMGAFGGTMTEP